ncbi:store-operated calcium entry-associated regulatory factor [Thalassophryne amazonica]|uniref:store-operated calcium entry-associated regulatory factor n=1 Tax=Thalassophryne amazonica TaxID=390379 RepID=UPI001470E40B|nr:store-operated calcium entry-associated regulatory factor [Thalassophryne amazonica]
MTFLIILLTFLYMDTVRSLSGDSVLLRDVQVLTLYKDRYTTARRSRPVLQLQCVGGSAGCHSFVPQVVQCQNKGWDGVDVQWECKTDMDSAYRFGPIEVTCEGYNHPHDDYILKGSCGLEYTLELTEEGRQRNQWGWNSQNGFKGFGGLGDFASSFFSGFSGNGRHHGHDQQAHQSSQRSHDGDFGGLLVVVLFLGIAYCVYKFFLTNNTNRWGQEGAQNGYNDDGHGSTTGPPPPGFRPDYTGENPGVNPGYGFRSEYTNTHHYPGSGATSGTNGSFWTGMGTGGVLGYLFGRQRNQPHHYHHSNFFASRPSTPRTFSHSTGTRTASGFGGTKRR